ncbi:MAG: hypothetical protein P8L20_00575 [Flavobacteriales bacterium]|nr:hypothetical protein [Flavobacteriales bacterium]
MKKVVIYMLVILTVLAGCNDEDNVIPKPKSYFRIDFPAKSYQGNKEKCNSSFEIPTYAYVQNKKGPREGVCFQNVVFPYYKASIYCTYLELDSNLFEHTEEYRNKAFEHQSRAQAIDEQLFVNEEERVFGTTFDIKGDVACNYIFYLTDSVDNFFAGSVFFEVIPNYDSLQPVLEFVKKDIQHLIETFKWENNPIE